MGYENAITDWEEYPQNLHAIGVEVGIPGIYNESSSLMYHTGHGYSHQLPYGLYSPVTTPLPCPNGDGHIYPQQYPFSGPYYQEALPHSIPYLTPPASVPRSDFQGPIDLQGPFLSDKTNYNSMSLGWGMNYNNTFGSYSRGSNTVNYSMPGVFDSRQSFDSFTSGGCWSDWLKSPEDSGSLTTLHSADASSQSLSGLGTFGKNITTSPSGMPMQSNYDFGSSTSSGQLYMHGGMYPNSNFGRYFPSTGTNGWNSVAFDKGRRRGKATLSLFSSGGTIDFLNEQNRGPRATRPKNPMPDESSFVDKDSSMIVCNRDLYNKSDFVTEYIDARFFVIKSYSEDNVHKSIKYGVWASTANGNRKLDSAYHEAKESEECCPVFLFFSVNASAQFCGVAEMIGPVDFERSVDYWQQDKWSGLFPVTWHIVKDVPNNIFRHIILDNNDNKPVTNSRDTQEVKLEQGLEMLSLFKKHESEMSVLDDFDFYEKREKAAMEAKNILAAASREEQQNHQAVAAVALPSCNIVDQMSKSFAQVVRLNARDTTEDASAAKACLVTVDGVSDDPKPATTTAKTDS